MPFVGIPIFNFQNLYHMTQTKNNMDFPSNTNLLKFDSKLQKVLEAREKIFKRSLDTITFSTPLLTQIEGLGVIFPNTINVIQGKKGVHKSRLTETICACFLDRNSSTRHIGFGSSENDNFKLVYVDTERNQKDQFPFAMQQIRKRAGFNYNENPEDFDFISLINIKREDRFECLKNYVELKQNAHPNKHFIIILDVVTDCIENFNDPRESMKLVDLMNELINEKNVTFICIIHENPGGEKARGHLGTEIINKASQVMQISFDGDSKELIIIKFLHSRNTKPLDPLFIAYDEESKGLITADNNLINKSHLSKQKVAPEHQVKAWIEKYTANMELFSKKELVEGLLNHFGCSERNIEERIKDLVDQGYITKYRAGRSTMYKLTKNQK